MNQQEHLNDSQIEQYARTVSVVGSEIDGKTDHLEAHLEDCAPCRERVLASVRIRFGLAGDFSVKVSPNLDPPAPDCPDEDVLRNFAAGNYPSNDAAKLLEHIARCDRCGPIMRVYTEDFSDELTLEDEAVLGGMKSSSPDRQRELAKRIGKNPDAPLELKKKPFHWRWVLAPVAVAVCALIAFAVWYSQRETPEKVEKLLAQAYREQRTIEMRWPGADYAPMTPRERGNSRNQSPMLFQAKALILKNLSKNGNDPHWLEALGQEELLEWHSDDAIADLNHALKLAPGSVSILVNLGIGHFQRAERSQSIDDYRYAIQLLGQALATDPNNSVALFNRALLFERMSPPLLESALDDWNRYLRVNPDGRWSEEAVRHKNEIEELKKKELSGTPR